MAGYSTTPLAKKLGIKAGMTAYFHAAPENVMAELAPSLTDATVKARLVPDLDFIHAFVASAAALEKSFPHWKKHLAKTGALWISWPKKASGWKTDLSDTVVRAVGLKAGLVDIKGCAVDELWSGLKFVYRTKDR